MKLAAVTMVYNEPDYMGLWCRHYGAQVGAENCYVIDHGSNDGSTDDLGAVNVIRIPRSPKDNEVRARVVSDFCSGLLKAYDAVLHVDVDELLVADPRYHLGLRDCAAMMTARVLHAIGLEVWHLPESEPEIDTQRPISLQRGWTWFNSALCKPTIIREPVNWAPGFHSVAAPIAFEHLYLFHLRYFDRERGLQRLARTRSMAWAHDYAGPHQRQPDKGWLGILSGVSRLPKEKNEDLDVGDEPLASLLLKVIESQVGRESATYRTALDITGHSLTPLPARFKGTF